MFIYGEEYFTIYWTRSSVFVYMRYVYWDITISILILGIGTVIGDDSQECVR